ncbi:MAG: hypothetical protein H6882_04455 [Rhodobiaceae bacterium]|nr:hypothetical protein [Rhodobiaceae bacterium]
MGNPAPLLSDVELSVGWCRSRRCHGVEVGHGAGSEGLSIVPVAEPALMVGLICEISTKEPLSGAVTYSESLKLV